MKRALFRSLVFTATLFSFLFFFGANVAAQTNLMVNGSFEDNTGWWGDADYWEKGGSPSYKGTTASVVYEGEWAFSYGNDYGPENAGGYCLHILRDPDNHSNLYPINAGDIFTLTMHLKSEVNYTGSAIIKVEFYGYDRRSGYNGAPLACIQSDTHTGGFNWLQEVVSGTAPEGTVSVAIVCTSEGMATGSGFSMIHFDDAVVVVEKNLLLNFSFEDNTGWGGDADYWEKGGNTAYKGVIEANAHQGTWAFNIGNDYGPSGANSYTLQILRDPANSSNLYPVTPGEIISFNMWMTGEASYTGNALLKIEFYDYDRNGGYIRAPIETFTSTAHTGEFAYLPETVVGVAPGGTVSIAVVCSSEAMQTGSGYSAVNFDDGCVLVQAPITAKELIDFNDSWQIAPTQTDSPPPASDYTRVVNVPGLVDLAEPPIDDVKNCWAYDYFWYKKTFTLSSAQEHSHAFLKIDQARYATDVWLNGIHIGNYIGCFTSHKYDASEAIKYGDENELIVRVSQKRLLPTYSAVGYDYEEDTWVPGIWGDVSLSLLSNPIIERVQIIPHIDTGIAEARITVKNLNSSAQNISISSQAFKKTGGAVASLEITDDFTISPFEEATFNLEVLIPGVNLWSPDDPFLYELVSKVEFAGMETDNLTTTFGMREFKIVGSDFYLNNHRIFLKGGNICFHRFLSDPDREGRPWNDEWIKAVLIDIPKAYNFNFFRMHMGHANNKWYDIADEHGILLEDEWGFRAPCKFPYDWLPAGPGYGSEDQIRKEFTQWVYDNCNHPSIIIWDTQNEPSDPDGYQSRDTVRDIIIPEMKEIDPTRPWECGINRFIDFPPGGWNPIDFSEDHPYTYSNGPVLNARNFGYSRSIDAMRDSEEPTILNEYIWFWLDSEGEAVGFTMAVLPRWLGRNATAEECMEHQSLIASDLTELWRRLGIDGVAPFCYLSSSEAGTTNWLTDVADPSPEKVLPVMYALKDIYAPFGVSIELWDRHFFPSETRDIDVYVFNDSWQGKPGTWQDKSGTLNYKVTNKDETETFFEGSIGVIVPPSDVLIETISWDMPAETGTYYLLAELVENSEIVARSKKIIHISEAVIPDNLAAAKIMVYDPDSEILDYLGSILSGASNYNSTQLFDQDVLILGEGALLDGSYSSRIGEITNFVKAGGSLIVIEPSYGVSGYEAQEYSLLSDRTVKMNQRDDTEDGGYDSYCFIEENNFAEVSASSVENDNYAPEKAFDGNMATRWASEHSDPQWICVDFGQRATINGVTLYWETAYATAYQIEISDDKESWAEVYSTVAGDGGMDEIAFSPVDARYIRMYGTQRATQWGYSLYEFEVDAEFNYPLWNNIDQEHLKMFNGGWGGEMISECDVNYAANKWVILAKSGLSLRYPNISVTTYDEGRIVLSRIQVRGRLTKEADPEAGLYSRRVDPVARQCLLNLMSTYLDNSNIPSMPWLYIREVTASSEEGDRGDYEPNKAADNDLVSRWSSVSKEDPQWICFDLGKSVKLNRVVLSWENAHATSYNIGVSDDANNWTEVYSTTTGDGGTDDIVFDAVTARYVRMYGTARANDEWGYSLYEVRVYAPLEAGQVSGVVTIQTRTNHSETITFELRNPGETEPIATFDIETDSAGKYSLSGISAGTYDLTAKSSNTLRAKNENIIVVDDETIIDIDFALLGGDANDDNSVGLSDRFILMKSWNTNIGDVDWDERADFNNDNSIGLSDRFIFRSNWNTSGVE